MIFQIKHGGQVYFSKTEEETVEKLKSIGFTPSEIPDGVTGAIKSADGILHAEVTVLDDDAADQKAKSNEKLKLILMEND